MAKFRKKKYFHNFLMNKELKERTNIKKVTSFINKCKERIIQIKFNYLNV